MSLKTDAEKSNPPPDFVEQVREVVREELQAARRRDAAPQMLEVSDVAEALKVSERHVQTLLHAGEIASVKVGRCRRVPADAVEAYIRRQAGEGRTDG
jgi:excisionase family DNA binding protein